MIPIFDEVYSLDKICYEKGLSEDILMENASQSIYKEIKKRDLSLFVLLQGVGIMGLMG